MRQKNWQKLYAPEKTDKSFMRQKKEKLGYSRGSSANSDIIKTEEGDKSTTYIIPAATDSTVKVLDRYETTTILDKDFTYLLGDRTTK